MEVLERRNLRVPSRKCGADEDETVKSVSRNRYNEADQWRLFGDAVVSALLQ
jgi:hypothetical protein